jgi:uncharacterized protein (TIGR04255 family)
MPFPEVKRILYGRNPLDQVICQLRFPPILRIDAEIPASFQDGVRGFFSNFSEVSEWNIDLPELKGPIPPDILRQALQSVGNKNYEFSSEDGQWKINLTRTFVALTAKKYERWEQFKERLEIPLRTLIDVYAPEYLSRIGLRYIDIIKRSALDLDGVNWNELLQPYILGITGSAVGDQVTSFESKYELNLSDKVSIVRIITKFVKVVDTDEVCYMIDSDFHNTHKTGIDSVFEKLDYLNTRASRLIQWAVTEKLHRAMEPREL